MAQTRRFYFVLFASLALAGTLSFSQVAKAATTIIDPVTGLQSVFGDPAAFVATFKSNVKDRSDQVIGLLIAGSGFVYAIKVFTN